MATPRDSARFLFYSHDSYGLGHLRRTLALTWAVGEGGDASSLILTGSPLADGFRLPRGVDTVKLPSVTKTAAGGYRPRQMTVGLDRLHAIRAALALAAARAFEPAVTVVNKAPLGLNGEMVPALEELRSRGCALVLGLRDVEDSPANVRREWRRAGMQDAIRRHYDEILVYGPPSCPDALYCTGWADRDIPVHHVGYVGARVPSAGAPDLPSEYVLVTLGGGGDGFPVLVAMAAAIRRRPLPCPAVIVTGPLMPEREIRRLVLLTAGLAVRVVQFRPDMESVIAGARAVVARAGYNTVSEILRSRRPGLLLPRLAPREEQLVRARAVSAAGLADMLHPDDVTPTRLRDALDRLLEREPPRLGSGEGDGAGRAAAILRRLSAARLAAAPAPATRAPPELSHAI